MKRTRRIAPLINPPSSYRVEIDDCLTMREVMDCWYISKTYCLYLIQTYQIHAKKSGKTWLISRSSVEAVLGERKRVVAYELMF